MANQKPLVVYHGMLISLLIFCATSSLKPLSHQGGVLAAFYKNAERQGERRENSMDAVATRWELHRTPWEILERQGLAFLLDSDAQNKRHHSAS